MYSRSMRFLKYFFAKLCLFFIVSAHNFGKTSEKTLMSIFNQWSKLNFSLNAQPEIQILSAANFIYLSQSQLSAQSFLLRTLINHLNRNRLLISQSGHAYHYGYQTGCFISTKTIEVNYVQTLKKLQQILKMMISEILICPLLSFTLIYRATNYLKCFIG